MQSLRKQLLNRLRTEAGIQLSGTTLDYMVKQSNNFQMSITDRIKTILDSGFEDFVKFIKEADSPKVSYLTDADPGFYVGCDGEGI